MSRVFILLAALLFPPLFTADAQCAGPRTVLLLEHGEPSAWNNLLRNGFLDASAKAGVQAEIVIAPIGSDQTEAFRKAAASNDLVIVVSDSLHEILRDNASNFRRVMFGSIDAGIRAPNIMSVTFADEQAAYLAGVAAAMSASKEGEPVIGWLSGMDTPAMRSLFNGFAEGARLARPDCRIIQALAGSFTDGDSAAGKTRFLLDAGAKVIALASGAGNESARKVLEGTQTGIIELDAASGRPALGAITKALDKAVAEIVASAASGHFAGKQILVYDLKNGGVNFELSHDANKMTSADIARRVKELKGELANGSIRVPSLRQRTLCDCLD